MAKPTTHKLEQKRDSKGSFWKCNRCNTESGASNMGQADAGMGPCISIDTRPLVGHSEPGIVYLETPAERQRHEAILREEQIAVQEMKATVKQIGYIHALIRGSAHPAQEAKGIDFDSSDQA